MIELAEGPKRKLLAPLKETFMQKLTPCLWFNFNAEEAVEHYLSIFKKGKVLTMRFELGLRGQVKRR